MRPAGKPCDPKESGVKALHTRPRLSASLRQPLPHTWALGAALRSRERRAMPVAWAPYHVGRGREWPRIPLLPTSGLCPVPVGALTLLTSNCRMRLACFPISYPWTTRVHSLLSSAHPTSASSPPRLCSAIMHYG